MTKRLLCYSIISSDRCAFGNYCTYAHSFEDQVLDDTRKKAYELMALDDMSQMGKEDYDLLFPLVHFCDRCLKKKCTGGYNCRNGAFIPTVKICKNDFCTGSCSNAVQTIVLETHVQDKLKCENVKGCKNGMHLTLKKMIPHNKYLHIQDRNSRSEYHSTRTIYNPIHFIRLCNDLGFESDSSTDEELDRAMAEFAYS